MLDAAALAVVVVLTLKPDVPEVDETAPDHRRIRWSPALASVAALALAPPYTLNAIAPAAAAAACKNPRRVRTVGEIRLPDGQISDALQDVLRLMEEWFFLEVMTFNVCCYVGR